MLTTDTERLIIRNFTVADAKQLHEIIRQYAASPYAAYDHTWPTDVEEIQKVAEWFSNGDQFLAVCIKESASLIGLISLNAGDDADTKEYGLGYIFNFDYHGRGYATEACQTLLDIAFTKLKADQVTCGTAAVNKPSCRLMKRLGFQIVSEEKASFQTNENGKPLEFIAYSFVLTKDAWKAKVNLTSDTSPKEDIDD